MHATLNLDALPVEDLSAADLVGVDGGVDVWKWAKRAGVAGAVVWVIDNWQDIEQGFIDNYDPR